MLSCPSCSTLLSDLKSVTPGETPSPGDGIVCPCGVILIYEKGFFSGKFQEFARPMTEEELNAMSEDERKDLTFAARILSAAEARLAEKNHQ